MVPLGFLGLSLFRLFPIEIVSPRVLWLSTRFSTPLSLFSSSPSIVAWSHHLFPLYRDHLYILYSALHIRSLYLGSRTKTLAVQPAAAMAVGRCRRQLLLFSHTVTPGRWSQPT